MFLKIYLIALPIFFIIDMIWLGVIAKGFYAKEIGFLLKENVNWTAAIIFYLLLIAGMVFFAISPALEKGSLQYAVLAGAFFGLITYATYDLTNLATVKDWPLIVTVVDMIWGTVLGFTVSAITYILAQRML